MKSKAQWNRGVAGNGVSGAQSSTAQSSTLFSQLKSEGFEGAESAAKGKGLGPLASRMHSLLPAKSGPYDAMRLRSQRDVIRDVMIAAAECGSWLTLAELRALTKYGEASISAQLRHLRKLEHGGYRVEKRHREDGAVAPEAAIDRKEFTWEYRVSGQFGVNLPTGSGSTQENFPA